MWLLSHTNFCMPYDAQKWVQFGDWIPAIHHFNRIWVKNRKWKVPLGSCLKRTIWYLIQSRSRSRPAFCLLLGVSSDYAQPITDQVTEVTCPVIGRAQPELTPSKRQKMGSGQPDKAANTSSKHCLSSTIDSMLPEQDLHIQTAPGIKARSIYLPTSVWDIGPFQYQDSLNRVQISIVKIRWSSDGLIFKVGIIYLKRLSLYRNRALTAPPDLRHPQEAYPHIT